jgi:hypothetical protein
MTALLGKGSAFYERCARPMPLKPQVNEDRSLSFV